MAERPLLDRLLGAELDALERILTRGERGKYAGRAFTDWDADHHFTKADGHIVRSGALYAARDEGPDGTGELHVHNAILRLLMVAGCVRHEEEAGS
ncbi:MAG TPA: hypothetical protein VLC09_14725 [Polyangiaceae bacterium]|nr:hypothetical protein [Polyangiaceae bacterium]